MNKQQATFDDFFSECYLKYKEYIKNYIAIRICHPHEAEDLAQDVFVRLWEHRAFVNKDTVWSLLFTIARNIDRKSTRLNSSHTTVSRMPSSA